MYTVLSLILFHDISQYDTILGLLIILIAYLNNFDDPIIATLLRTYPGIFDMQTNINTFFIAKKLNCTETSVLNLLEKLKKLNIISYFSQESESKITFLEVREDDKTINRISKHLESQNFAKKNQLESVFKYVSDTKSCKNKLLLSYFGEITLTNCGNCSFCNTKKSKETNVDDIRNEILDKLSKSAMSSREISDNLNIESSEILKVLKQLLEHNIISINNKNQFKIV